jgi:hypothetical protein
MNIHTGAKSPGQGCSAFFTMKGFFIGHRKMFLSIYIQYSFYSCYLLFNSQVKCQLKKPQIMANIVLHQVEVKRQLMCRA